MRTWKVSFLKNKVAWVAPKDQTSGGVTGGERPAHFKGIKMNKVERPVAEQKKINCKDEFELCYLRHQYIRKVDFNPTALEMAPYDVIVSQQAKNTYFTYLSLFGSVGLGCEDIMSIAKTHTVSYLGLFSLDKLEGKREEFTNIFQIQNGKDPQERDFLNKNKANFTMFLKQRMEDLVRVCRQKNRNIRGLPGDEHYIYCGERKPPKIISNLIKNYDKYGYKKLDIAVFKTIRKRAKAHGSQVFQFDGLWYVALRCEHKNLDISDFAGADMDPHDSLHNMSPERIYFDREEGSFWEGKRAEFDAYEPKKRSKLLTAFVNKHKNKSKFKEEVRLARKLIKELGV